MRTDPRADEVRNIVEEVFSRYIQECREREIGPRFSSPRRHEDSQAGCRWHEAERFPRLYQPELFDLAEEDNTPVLPEIDETILIDEGHYVARSYRTKGYMAMWLVAVGIVQFYDERGQMLATINLFELLRPQKIAA
ncbi:MAG: hypothetical protein ABSG53_29970 [Thermoguttaceae bacterium]|jgi:hypothetical protein